MEKLTLPLYGKEPLKNGVYVDYKTFSKQVPSDSIILKQFSIGERVFYQYSNDGKTKSINYKTAYSIVYGGKPYIVTKFGIYKLEKVNNDFYFFGNVQISNTVPQMLGIGMLGGLGLIVNHRNLEEKIFQLDHLDGSYIEIIEK